MKPTMDLLKETFASIPNKFAYREVRFYVYNALQRLEAIEKREGIRTKQSQVDRLREEEKKKTQNWQPPIYQNDYQAKQTLDILDKMIGEEKKIIESIRHKNKGQTVKNDEHPYEDDEQTLHG